MANDALRQHREAHLSPSGNGKPMTRAELAEAVNEHVWSSTNRQITLDADTISRYERGLIRWPNSTYRSGLRAVLGVRSDSDLGFYPTRRGRSATTTPAEASRSADPIDGHDLAEGGDDVNRRQFLQTLGAVTAVGAGMSLAGIAEDLRSFAGSTTVSEVDIARLEAASSFYTAWAHAHGSDQLGGAVSTEMSAAASLLEQPCPARLRSDLLTAAGQLGIATGALLFDSHQHQLSERVLAFATACAEEGGNWHLRAKALSWRARQAVWTGDSDAGLTFAQLGLVRDDRLTATERAMLHTAVARAHGRRGDVAATLRAIGEADDAFAAADPANDVPWMSYYDHAQHNGDTGHALAELAIHGVRVEETTQRLATAVAEHSASYVRSRAISGFKLAALTMHTGDPDQAVDLAKAASADAGGVRSKRLHRTALEIVHPAALHKHDRREDVADVLTTVRAVGIAS